MKGMLRWRVSTRYGHKHHWTVLGKHVMSLMSRATIGRIVMVVMIVVAIGSIDVGLIAMSG